MIIKLLKFILVNRATVLLSKIFKIKGEKKGVLGKALEIYGDKTPRKFRVFGDTFLGAGFSGISLSWFDKQLFTKNIGIILLLIAGCIAIKFISNFSHSRRK